VKIATAALRRLFARAAAAVGIEGMFLAVGTALLAVFASYLSPAGPFLVVGVMCVLAGVALAIPPRKVS
jgi:uncharacterized membrane protein (DUF106 family)